MLRIIVVVCLFCFFFNGEASAAEPVYIKDACVWESFEANCGDGKVLLIRKAFFGRLRSGRCFNLTSGEKPCYADVQSFVERHCGGRRDCRIKLTNENLKLFSSNCSIYSQKSLEIEYSCEVVYTARDQSCVSNQSLLVTNRDGFLANIVTDTTGQGSQTCPWRFEPQPGQTVHLTLLDFGVWIDRADRDRRNICRIYATIKEIATTYQKLDILVCGGVEREKFIMSTDTEITIAVMKQENTVNDTAYFFIKYQVFDCPNYEAPTNAVTERSGSGIQITCQYNRDRVWEVKCVAGDWMPRHDIRCPEMTTSALVPSVSPCPEIQPIEGITILQTDNGYVASCSDGTFVELLCVNQKWTSSEQSPCFYIIVPSAPPSTDFPPDQMKLIVIVATVVGAALVVAVVASLIIVACRKKRKPANEMKCSMRSHQNNSYYTTQLLPDPPTDRARSEIYETLDESRMQDVHDAPPLPCSSNFNHCSSPRSAKTLQANQKLDPWPETCAERRGGTLPVHRPLPEPHEYTTPIKRDSTYLMPREPVYLNPVVVDDMATPKMPAGLEADIVY